jgi:flavodoxin
MKKVFVVYFSTSGKTGSMAEFIAEGIRFNGLNASMQTMHEIKNPAQLPGYDGYILGSPTFSLDIPGPVKIFLAMFKNINGKGKLSGAFGPYLHDSSYHHEDYAPDKILDILQNEYKFERFDLDALCLREDVLETRDGMKACQDYGRIFGQKLIL